VNIRESIRQSHMKSVKYCRNSAKKDLETRQNTLSWPHERGLRRWCNWQKWGWKRSTKGNKIPCSDDEISYAAGGILL